MTDFHPALLEHYISSNQRASLASWGLTLASWGLLSLGVVTHTPVRIGFLGASLACCAIAKPVRSISIATERTRDDFRDISTQSFQNWLYSRMKPDTATVDFHQEDATAEPETYDFDSILDEAVGIALLGNSGSGKSSVAKYIVGLMGQTQILVLDPHDDGDTWDGLPVISEYADIVSQLGLLLTELDNRRAQRKQKQKLEPLTVICDEFPAVRDYCAQIDSDVADRFILRFGSESRKFEMLCLFCSQSGNTKALGLDGKGDFLENYLLIRLHKVARKYAKNLSDRTVLARIQPELCGFPCLVGDEVSVHPTHGHYAKFAKGLPPKNLKPLRSLPLTIDLAAKVDYTPLSAEVGATASTAATPPPTTSTDQRTHLEDLWHLILDESVPTDSTHLAPGATPPENPLNGENGESAEVSADEFAIADNVLKGFILEYRDMGFVGQDAFIDAFWGIKKGSGNARYLKARDLYQSVCHKFGL